MLNYAPRFTVRGLLLIIALIAVALTLCMSLTRSVPSGQAYNEVKHLTFSPDGRNLAVVGLTARDADVPLKVYFADVCRTIVILDTDTLSKARIVQREFREGIQGPLINLNWNTSVAFTFGGDRLYVLERVGGQLRTLDIESGDWLSVPAVDETSVYGFVLSPNGETLASRQADGLSISDVKSRQPVLSLSDGWPLNFSRDGKRLAINGPEGVEIWDVELEKLVRKIHENHNVLDRVTCAVLSPDGDAVAVRCNQGLRLYTISSGKEQLLLPEFYEVVYQTDRGSKIIDRPGDTTIGVAFSPDGTLLATWGAYGLKFFDMPDASKLHRSLADPSVSHLAFSPDGKIYATGHRNGKVALWETASGKKLRSTKLRGSVAIQ